MKIGTHLLIIYSIGILIFVHCTQNKQSQTDKYTIIDNDTIYTFGYPFSYLKKPINILVIDSVSALSYDGNLAFTLTYSDKGVEDENIYLSVSRLNDNILIRKLNINEIIQKSKFKNIILSNSDKYFFNYDIRRVFSSSKGLVIFSKWLNSNSDYENSGMFLFINRNLELENIAYVDEINIEPDFCIIRGDSAIFTHGLYVNGIYNFKNRYYNEVDLNYDYANLEIFYRDSNHFNFNTYNNFKYQQLPKNIFPKINFLNGKILDLIKNENDTPFIEIFDIKSKKLQLIKSDSLIRMLEKKQDWQSFKICGLNKSYIYFTNYKYEHFEFNNYNKIYRLPINILNQ